MTHFSMDGLEKAIEERVRKTYLSVSHSNICINRWHLVSLASNHRLSPLGSSPISGNPQDLSK